MSNTSSSDVSMSSYLAWDGKTYEGSPPTGWYLANDSRWWPSQQIISENADNPGPDGNDYAKPYLDDDEAYGREYANDPAFDDESDPQRQPTPAESLDGSSTPIDQPSSAAPSNSLSSRSTQTRTPSNSELERMATESPSTNAEPALTRSPGPPPGNSHRPPVQSRPKSPLRKFQRGLSLAIFFVIALARCAGDSDTQVDLPATSTTSHFSEEGLTFS